MYNKVEYTTVQDIIIKSSTLKQKGIIFINSESEEQFFSYKQLYINAIQLLGSFQTMGIKENTLLVFQIDNNLEFITAFWACILGKIVPVPLAIATSDDIYEKIIRVCNILNCPYVLFDETGYNRFEKYISKSNQHTDYKDIMQVLHYEQLSIGVTEGNIVKCTGDDLAFIQFSSGSTGNPKGVMLSHSNLAANTDGILDGLHLNKSDSCLSWMPLTHDMGLIGFHISPMRLQINQYLMPTSLFVYSPLLWLRKASEHSITVLASPNFGYTYYLKALGKKGSEELDLSSVQTIFNGAEPISLKTCQAFLDTMQQYGLKNNTIFSVYGLAEACLAVAFPKVMEELRYVTIDGTKLGIGEQVSFTVDDKKVNCVIEGKAVKHCSIKIIDEEGNIVPEDVIGYIKIKGKNVTKGYYNNESETSRIFDTDGWLNTGDLGFFHNEELVVTGRAKDIIFVNGKNFFSHDIEEFVIQNSSIINGKVAVAGYHNSQTEKEEILVFHVFRGKMEKFIEVVNNVTSLIWNRLGISVTHVIPVMKIPKTTSGKLQRYKLVESYCKGEMQESLEELKLLEEAQCDSIQLMDEDVELFTSIVGEFYHVEKNIMGKKLWELEGDSLTASRFCSQLNSKFHIHIELQDLFKANTLGDVYAYTKNMDMKLYDPIEKVTELEEYELSPEQKRMYLLYKLNPLSTSYNVPVAIKVSGKIDIPKFEKSILKMIQYQKILQTNFYEQENIPYQHLNNLNTFHMQIINEKNKSINEIFYDFVQPFHLESDLLIRAAYVVDKHQDSYILFDFHHIVCDGSSCGIMIRNLIEFYNDRDLPKLSISYLDYAYWRNKCVVGMDKDREFFCNLLSNIPERLEFKTKQNNKEMTDTASSKVFYIEDELLPKMKQLLNEKQLTLHNFLLGAYSVLLSLYTDQTEMVIGSPCAARSKSELYDLVGVFMNTVPVPCSLDYDNQTYIKYLDKLNNMLLSIYSHQEYPYAMIVKDVNETNQNVDKNSIYQTMFTFQNMDIPEFNLGDAVLKIFDCEVKDAKFDLSMEVMPYQERLKVKITYRKACFSKTMIEEMSKLYIQIINHMVQNIDANMRSVEAIYKKEEKGLVSKEDFGDSFELGLRLQNVIAKYSDRTAVVFEGSELNYKELSLNVRKIQSCIQSYNIGVRGYIPVVMSAQLNLVSVLLAIWESGNAFVPIDPDYPEEMVRDIIEDCNASICIVQEQNAKMVGNRNYILVEDALGYEFYEERGSEFIHNTEDIMYAIYTSGTTGKHKGVKICNRNLSNYLSWFTSINRITCHDKTMLMSSHCFDLGYTALFSAIFSGAELHIISKERYHDPDYVLNYIKLQKITYLKLTPSLLHMMLLSNTYEKGDVLESIRLIVMGGENVRISDVQDISKRYEHITFMNHYGPTEATIGTVYKVLDRELIHGKKWTNVIGQPITNMRARICNQKGIVVPNGVAGELILIGESVSEGYINNNQMTEKSFFGIEEEGRKYKAFRTGDLCRVNEQGDIEFIERIDKQIKIRGFRIEIMQIVNAIRDCKNVDDVVVAKTKIKNMSEALCAYVVGSCDLELLKEELRNKLPYYMIPTHFAKIDSIVVTENGKIDYKKLPPIVVQDKSGECVIPKNEMEQCFIEVWKKVLVKENVYYTDDFFVCGGDSIKAVELVSELHKRNIKLEVNKVLQYSLVKELLSLIKMVTIDIEQGTVTGEIKLTPIQKRFFEGQEYVDVYNQSIIVKCRHRISKEILNQALVAITEHHDTLRMRFQSTMEEVSQIDQDINECWELQEWSLKEGQNIESSEIKERLKQVEESMNLNSGKLIKTVLIHGDEDYVYITIHHLIIDGVSWRILIRDLDKAYTQLMSGQKASLGTKTVSYKQWSEELYELPAVHEAISFWDKRNDSAGSMLYKDYNNGNGTYADNVVYEFEYEIDNMDEFKTEINRVYNTDISNILLAAYLKSIQNLLSRDKIEVYLESYGRSELNKKIDVSSTIGWFTSIYPILVEIKQKDVSDIIVQVKENNKKIPYLGVGYGILRYLRNRIDIHEKEEEIAFNYLGDFDNVVKLDNFEEVGKTVKIYADQRRKRPYSLTLECMIVDRIVRFRLNYSRNQYSKDTIQSIGNSVIEALQGILITCKNSNSMVMTPSDFGDDELTMEEIDAIARLL